MSVRALACIVEERSFSRNLYQRYKYQSQHVLQFTSHLTFGAEIWGLSLGPRRRRVCSSFFVEDARLCHFLSIPIFAALCFFSNVMRTKIEVKLPAATGAGTIIF